MNRKSLPARETAARRSLKQRLLQALHGGAFADDRQFADLADAVLVYQRRFAADRPPVAPLPVEIFKYRPVGTCVGRPGVEFFSSGTTRGRDGRSCHRLDSADLYEAGLQRGFAQSLLGHAALDTAWSVTAPRWNLLVPATVSWWSDRHSSLAHMGRTLWRSLQANTAAQLHRIDPAASRPEFRRAVARLAATADTAVTLGFGTGFGFLHLLERLQAERFELPLHPSSRVMETGGYKGRGRELPPLELHRRLARAFGLPENQVCAEYGMTELSSQAYQVFDRSDAPWPELPVYRPTETLRVRAVDPAGRPCLPGVVGLLEVCDPLNLTSAAWLLLGDVGLTLPTATNAPLPADAAMAPPHRCCDFQVLGRAQRLAARGCGLAVDFHWTETAAARKGRRSLPRAPQIKVRR